MNTSYSIGLGRRVAKVITVTAAIIAIPATTAAVFAFGQFVANNDHRLFKADDERRTRMIARACGKHGQLWQASESGEYACIFTNPDGSTLIHQVSNAPLLSVSR
jgi:hypothetical protein